MQKIRPDMDIGKNIQSIRYKNNLTQDQVIAKLNLMPSWSYKNEPVIPISEKAG